MFASARRRNERAVIVRDTAGAILVPARATKSARQQRVCRSGCSFDTKRTGRTTVPARQQQRQSSKKGREEDTALPPPEALYPQVAAIRARLRYVSDTSPGFTRHRTNGGFEYRLPAGAPVGDADTLRRIRALAIPPAWTEVWICPDPNGHL